MATRGKPPGSPKTGGRVKGKSLDKGERQLVTSQMAGDIMAVYESLGGIEWLLKWARANPKDFIQAGLSRLFPAAARDDDAGAAPSSPLININNLGDFEAARRIAFALAKAAYEQEQLPPVIEAVRVTSSRAPEPVIEPNAWTPPTVAPEPQIPSDLARDLARERWVNELPLTDEQRADAAVVRETVECDISNYRGSPAEQPGGTAPLRPSSQPSAGDRRRAVMSRRGRDLL